MLAMSQEPNMRKAYSYIRMSTETQLKGDSLRRQLEASEAYAKQHNLQLVDSIDGTPFKDIGVSAYRGLNAQEGALGVFLKALQEGKVEQDSVLLIESLDRLSRDKLLSAFSQFTSILNAGIEIVTISDSQRYTRDSVNSNMGQLFISLGIMFRANEESETKSKRIRAAWENKRNEAASKPITTLCPAWLRYNAETGKFDKIPERVKVVKFIFKLCIESCGLYAIAKQLNGKKEPVFGRSKYWHRSYIKKVLSSRAVLGEFQAHQLVKGKRQAIGDPIKGYFPQIIDEQTFLLANAALVRRDQSAKGRKGKNYSNLLTGLVYCGSCGNRMTLRNHGNPPKGGRYFKCTSNQVGAGCTSPEWKMSEVESSIFQHLIEVDFSSLLNNEASRLHEINQAIEALKTSLDVKNQAANRASELLVANDLSAEAKSRVISQLNEIENEITRTKAALEQKEVERSEEEDAQRILSGDTLKQMIGLLEANSDDYIFRASVNQLLAKAIEKITLIQDLHSFQPWDFDDESPVVIKYRLMNPRFTDVELSAFVETRDFQALAKQYTRQISIRYRTGATRHILDGYGTSIIRQPNPAVRSGPHK